ASISLCTVYLHDALPICVTEQGEMIRFKFGLEGIALQNLEIYSAATLEATLLPPPEPKPEWRELMHQMTDLSVQVYRQTVRENPDRKSTRLNSSHVKISY